jgi:hypothetical protein
LKHELFLPFNRSFDHQIADISTGSRQESGQQYYVYETFDLSWATKAMLNTLSESQWGDPVEPAEHGLLSTFREKFSVDENASTLGQKIFADVHPSHLILNSIFINYFIGIRRVDIYAFDSR